jgi:hypothetical protein
MVPQPGRKGATVQVAMAEPTPVMPMPYPMFRVSQRSQPAAPVENVVASPDARCPTRRKSPRSWRSRFSSPPPTRTRRSRPRGRNRLPSSRPCRPPA